MAEVTEERVFLSSGGRIDEESALAAKQRAFLVGFKLK